MKAGKKKKVSFGGGGGNNAKLNQLKSMQEAMLAKEKEIEQEEFEASVGGDALSAKVNGKKELLALDIKNDDLLKDKDMLIDLTISAINEAIRKADEKMSNAMEEFTGGMDLPNF